MLVLTRKYQEKVHIGDGITIIILRTKGKAVRLGIEAPADVPVIRGELAFSKSPIETAMEAVGTNKSDRGSSEERARQPNRKPTRDHSSANWRSELSADKKAPHVFVDRVSRHKAVQILPSLLTGNAPLRHMLQQRSGAI